MSRPNPELQLANAFVRETGCSIFLTGKAGTGKTTFLHNIKRTCGKRMIVTAPTGVAAINAGGVTLHSFFQMPFGPIIPGSQMGSRHKFSREKINIIKSLDLLVIDEISMVRADLLDGIDSVLRRYRRTDIAFGGIQLLFIGDLHQLAPVVKDDDWQLLKDHYDSPYFFSSKGLAEMELLSIELHQIYRQEDSRFIELLNRVRDNRVDDPTLEELNSRYTVGFIDPKDGGYITLCSHNSNADSINHSRLREIAQQGHRFEAEIEGDFPAHAYPAPSSLEVKKNAQVMFVRNDPTPDKRFFNGKIGKITRISTDGIWIQCPDDPEEIEVKPATWENIQYTVDPESLEIVENKVGAFIQYPLKLAWAITIHKSQGLTFDRAIVDAQAAFAHGQVYVALSRCRTLHGLFLSSPLTRKVIKTDRKVLGFNLAREKHVPTAALLDKERIRYQQQLLLECFDFQTLHLLVSRLVHMAEKNGQLLQVTGVGDLHEVRRKNIDELRTVGENFQRQLRGQFSKMLLPEEDNFVRERVTKASAYFQEKIETGIGKVLEHLHLESDNREIRKKATALCTLLQQETSVKLAAVKSCKNGFNTAQYLRAKSSAEIDSTVKKRKITGPVYTEADVAHPELYDSLKQWRSARASAENVPLFQVMHQKTLVQIAVNLPDSLSALLKINGIGKKLAGKYGDDLVAIVSKYREQHQIQEVLLPAPSTEQHAGAEEAAEKNQRESPAVATRLLSLELFLQELSLAEIAEKRCLSLATIEGHLARCIEKGEISVDRLLSPVAMLAIQQKLRQLPDKKLREIKAALGDLYSYGQIKFAQAHMKVDDNSAG